jgi:hypothetical protein
MNIYMVNEWWIFPLIPTFPLSLSLKISKKPKTWFGTRGSEVQILSPRPFKIQQKSKIFDVCRTSWANAPVGGIEGGAFFQNREAESLALPGSIPVSTLPIR